MKRKPGGTVVAMVPREVADLIRLLGRRLEVVLFVAAFLALEQCPRPHFHGVPFKPEPTER